MGGQSNIFNKPEQADPFGAPIKELQTGIFDGKEKRPNINPKQKQQAQADWEKSINGPQNKIK